ncbi:MAG: formate/nitrite transporter family protein [Candidatus Dormibacterales bacterium]
MPVTARARGERGGEEPDAVLGQEPEEIVSRAAGVGRERLDRSGLDVFLTGLIGGVEVSLGALAAMIVLGVVTGAFPRVGLYGGLALAGLVFPVGFLFVITGRSELFTENFLIPVVAVLTRERPVSSLAGVWALSWCGNLIGCGAMAALLSVPQAIGSPILDGYRAYSVYKLGLGTPGLFVSAMLAGMAMTVLTWMILAVRHPVGRMLVIWAAGYVLFAANLSHVIVSAAILLVGFARAGHDFLDVTRYIGVTTFGNLVGGVGLVTVFRFAQAREKQRRRRRPGLLG